MDKVSGISVSTANRLVLDAGALYYNYGLGTQRLIGATRGGSTFTLEQTNRHMAVDGAPGDVAGFDRIQYVIPKLSINLVEHSTANLLMCLAGAVNNATGTHDVITRVGQLSTASYLTNLTLVANKAGTSELFAVQISNAMNKGNFAFAFQDNDESAPSIEFTGHYAANALDGAEPWSISNPLEGSSGYFTLTYTAGANGSIIGDASQIVQDGGDGTAVYASADTGYHFVEWTDESTDNPRHDTSISGNVTQAATFAAD